MTRNGRPRVLLVDDHKEILVAVQRLLKPTCEIVGAIANPLLAIETVLTLRPDVVVLDLNMPEVNGFALCRQIVESVPAVRVVILTGLPRDETTDDEIEREAYCRGASACVRKLDMAERLPATIRLLFDDEPPSPAI